MRSIIFAKEEFAPLLRTEVNFKAEIFFKENLVILELGRKKRWDSITMLGCSEMLTQFFLKSYHSSGPVCNHFPES